MSTTRFPKGVTNVDGDNVLGNLKTVDPSKTFVWWEDFNTLKEQCWNQTTGTVPVGSPTLLFDKGNDQYGALAFGQSAGTTADDVFQIGFSGQTAASLAKTFVSLENNKRTFFKMRFKIDVPGHGINFGLFPGGAAQVWAVNSDEVSFLSSPGSTDLKLRVRQNSVAVVNDVVVGTVPTNGYVECAWEWYNGKLRVFINGSHVKTFDVPQDASRLYAFSNAVKASTATDYDMRIDYILIAQDR
jgi:hypothetical protein